MLTALVFLSGFILSATAAYYSIIGLIAIFPGATVAIAAMGISLELAKLVAASWLYRNRKTIPTLMKAYMGAAIVLLMLITSMGIFGFLSKAHIENQVTSVVDESTRIETLDASIASKERSLSLIERQINNIDRSLEKYLENDNVSRGLAQKRQLQPERKSLDVERRSLEQELIDLKTERNQIANTVKKQEVEIGPLKYIAAIVYGDDATNHFDSAVRMVIVLIIIVFDPLAVILLIAGNISLQQKQQQVVPEVKSLEPRPKRKYTRRKPLGAPKAETAPEVHEVQEEDFGIKTVNSKPLL
jgi:hypothetical protein